MRWTKTIRISAGKRGLQLEIAPKDLQQLTQATIFGKSSRWGGSMSEVTILHINDMHSNFHSIKEPQTRFMKERRAQLEKEGQKVFGIDLGDLIDRVHPWLKQRMERLRQEC